MDSFGRSRVVLREGSCQVFEGGCMNFAFWICSAFDVRIDGVCGPG